MVLAPLGRDDCPCCRRGALAPLKGYERAYLGICSSCGFVHAARTPSAEELEAHYAHKYERKYDPDAWVSDATRRRLGELADSFEPYRRSGRILDIGCGRGLLLEAAQARGWECYGTEYSEDALRHGRERGFVMVEGDYSPAVFDPDHFDIIAMIEVIEHMPEPRLGLQAILTALRPGGLLYITTPNFDSVSRRILRQSWNVIEYPAHLSYFTASTLRRLLTELELRSESIRTTGFSPTRFRKSRAGQRHLEIGKNDADEVVRRALERGRGLRWVKGGLNAILSATRLGDSLKGRFVKSGGDQAAARAG